ncbi:hypothetical protein Tco_0237392 [Tanacetum coccineum]
MAPSNNCNPNTNQPPVNNNQPPPVNDQPPPNAIDINSPNNPLYLHPNDHPGMMIALNAKNKLKIVTGEMIEPTVESEERALIYQLVNDILLLYLFVIVLELLENGKKEWGLGAKDERIDCVFMVGWTIWCYGFDKRMKTKRWYHDGPKHTTFSKNAGNCLLSASMPYRVHRIRCIILKQIRCLDSKTQYAVLIRRFDTSYPTGGYGVSGDQSEQNTI